MAFNFDFKQKMLPTAAQLLFSIWQECNQIFRMWCWMSLSDTYRLTNMLMNITAYHSRVWQALTNDVQVLGDQVQGLLW